MRAIAVDYRNPTYLVGKCCKFAIVTVAMLRYIKI